MNILLMRYFLEELNSQKVCCESLKKYGNIIRKSGKKSFISLEI